MENQFLSAAWPYLKNLYGEDVFKRYEFFIEDVYFQKWINPIRKQGYRINIFAKIESPPVNTLKNWEGAKGALLFLAFDGDFGLGHFPMKNRKLLQLIGKRVCFDFDAKPEETYPVVKVILPDAEISFRAKMLHIIGVSRIEQDF